MDKLLVVAVMIRSRENRTPYAALCVGGSVSGSLGATLPSAFMDRPFDSGLFGGAIYGIVGATFLAPIVIAGLVSLQVSDDAASGLVRDLYMQGLGFVIGRIGGLIAAIRQWMTFSIWAVLSGSAVGLADGLRHGYPLGRVSLEELGLAALVQVYCISFCFGLCVLLPGRLPALLIGSLLPFATPL